MLMIPRALVLGIVKTRPEGLKCRRSYSHQGKISHVSVAQVHSELTFGIPEEWSESVAQAWERKKCQQFKLKFKK